MKHAYALKCTVVLAGVFAAFAATAPTSARAKTGDETVRNSLFPDELAFSTAAAQAIQMKAETPAVIRSAFVRDNGPSWVQWRGQFKQVHK